MGDGRRFLRLLCLGHGRLLPSKSDLRRHILVENCAFFTICAELFSMHFHYITKTMCCQYVFYVFCHPRRWGGGRSAALARLGRWSKTRKGARRDLPLLMRRGMVAGYAARRRQICRVGEDRAVEQGAEGGAGGLMLAAWGKKSKKVGVTS